MHSNIAIRHAIYQQRYGSELVRKMVGLLNRAERDLFTQLEARLARIAEIGYDTGPMTTARIASMVADIKVINGESYKDFEKALTSNLIDFGEYEAQFQTSLLERYFPPSAGVDLKTPPLPIIRAAVTSEPFKGRLLSEWTADLSVSRFNRLRDSIRIGLVEGQTSSQIFSRIRGTRAGHYQDGIMEIDRRGAEALVRTAVNHVGNEAREATYEENSDIVDGVEWNSTLDSRTCEHCASLDGKTFKHGEGPRPPAHISCRCTTLPHFAPQFAAMAAAVGTTRASVGANGGEQVSSKLTYQTWLKSQPAAFQDETLGPTRGALFRRGDLTLDRFVNRNGDQLTLDELKVKHPASFAKANLE